MRFSNSLEFINSNLFFTILLPSLIIFFAMAKTLGIFLCGKLNDKILVRLFKDSM